MTMTMTTHTLALTLLLITLSNHVCCADITDLEATVRSSQQYRSLPTVGQCALAGSDSTGCWGQALFSAVRHSNCHDGEMSCFCAQDSQKTTYDYIIALATTIIQTANGVDTSTPTLAAKKYLELCNSTLAESELENSSTSNGSSNGSTNATTTTPPPDKSSSKIALGVGLGLGIPGFALTAYMAWLGTVTWKKYKQEKPVYDHGRSVHFVQYVFMQLPLPRHNNGNRPETWQITSHA